MSETKFFDYKTEPVNGSDVVDKTKTGMSFYNDFLNPSEVEYLRDEKNLKGTVVLMSPQKYFEMCANYGFPNPVSVESLKKQRRADTRTLQHLKDVLTEYKKKFPMPIINVAQNSQEGLHRMMVIAEMFGWDHEVPVLVVEYADKDRARRAKEQARKNRIESRIRKAILHATDYEYSNIEDFKDQLQWELDREFEFSDDIEPPIEFTLEEDAVSEEWIVTVSDVYSTIKYDEVKFSEKPVEDSNIDYDDIELDFDIEETKDFLKRYFGDNWEETHPHLKDML